jgi:hypothetical protein
MDAIKDSLIRAAKRSEMLRSVANSALVEMAFETFNFSLPARYRFMRLISRSDALRKAAAHMHAKGGHVPAFPTNETSFFPDLSVFDVAQTIEKKGFAQGIRLPEACLRAILDFCSKADFRSDRNPNVPVQIDLTGEANPRSESCYRCPNAHRQCETIDGIAHDPAIVQVARRYLRSEPVLLGSSVWWSYSYLGSDGTMPYVADYGFHYDIDDYKFLKLFFYLNDVDEERGPHVIIEGTHSRKDFFEKTHRRLRDEEALARYPGRIRVMTGEKGTGFFEDTFCYHKGTNPRKRRLILQIEYGLTKFTRE